MNTLIPVAPPSLEKPAFAIKQSPMHTLVPKQAVIPFSNDLNRPADPLKSKISSMTLIHLSRLLAWLPPLKAESREWVVLYRFRNPQSILPTVAAEQGATNPHAACARRSQQPSYTPSIYEQLHTRHATECNRSGSTDNERTKAHRGIELSSPIRTKTPLSTQRARLTSCCDSRCAWDARRSGWLLLLRHASCHQRQADGLSRELCEAGPEQH